MKPWFFVLILVMGCASSGVKERPVVRKEATLDQRLEKIPVYQRANYEINRGIDMMKLANLSVSLLDQDAYFEEAIKLFRKAIVLLEKAQDYLDQRDREILEKQIDLVQKYIITCLRDRPQKLKEKG